MAQDLTSGPKIWGTKAKNQHSLTSELSTPTHHQIVHPPLAHATEDMNTRRRETMNNVSWGEARYSSCPVYTWRLGSVAMVAFNGLILRNATNCNSSTPQLHNLQLDWLSHCMSPRSYICFLCPSQECKPDGPPPGPHPLQVSMLRSNSRTKYHC